VSEYDVWVSYEYVVRIAADNMAEACEIAGSSDCDAKTEGDLMSGPEVMHAEEIHGPENP
jgi:hypothetical protein